MAEIGFFLGFLGVCAVFTDHMAGGILLSIGAGMICVERICQVINSDE